ncbi:ankyrin repeat domain-containing protein [Aquimarina sp. MMG016]|uniref:ankyrin repeat domain-containing protein n=1 Tax=Aquimarina sp. MMG016 TaxID=2822690 RepID=UPI001B3A5FAA|nr:ankyrin repeat domain-containing protein [Aquimarina sp. MMG016]MBQ4818945.1 ankyrin repeat domain-containing protein [Aquimarina sp. MMG016]
MDVSGKIKELLKNLDSIDVHSLDPLGETHLMSACRLDADAAIDLLIKKGADVNYYNEKSIGGPATALMCAAETNAVKTIQLLIENKVEIDAKHKVNGMTALMFAAKNNAKEGLSILIESEANMETKTFGLIGPGQTALVFAIKESNKEIADFLIKKGAKAKPLRAVDRKKIPIPMIKWLKSKGAL